MTDITTFVRARLDEEQAAAEAASHGGRWRYEPGESVGAWTLYDEHWNIASVTTYDTEAYDYVDRMPAYRSPSYIDPDANGQHIARHDPARVLAQVAAMRAIVGDYEEAEDLYRRDRNEAIWSSSAAALERAVCHLAAIWRDHSDYDPAWAPEGE